MKFVNEPRLDVFVGSSVILHAMTMVMAHIIMDQCVYSSTTASPKNCLHEGMLVGYVLIVDQLAPCNDIAAAFPAINAK